MSEPLVFAIPGDIDTPSGGYGYDRRLMRELEARGRPVRYLALPDGFPLPDAKARTEADAAFDALADGTLVLIDGLAFGAMAEAASRNRGRLRLVALVHHPLALENGLDPSARRSLAESERRALAAARAVVVTSEATAHTLRKDYAVETAKLTVAPPGVDRPASKPSVGRSHDDAPVILSVGTLIARKDHATLIDALARIADRPWRARIVGAPAHAETAHALGEQIEAHGLRERVTLTGAVAEIESEFAAASIFALASRYEGYGMVYAEAMTHSLPIVACDHPASRALIPAGAGGLVASGDSLAFAAALADLLDDPDRYMAATRASAAAGESLHGWGHTAALVDAALVDAALDEVAP